MRYKVSFTPPPIHQMSDGIKHVMYCQMVNVIHRALDERVVIMYLFGNHISMNHIFDFQVSVISSNSNETNM